MEFAERAPGRRAVELRLPPSPAYPFSLDLRLDYALRGDRLTVTFAAPTRGDGALPFAAGFHPYLTAGGEAIESHGGDGA